MSRINKLLVDHIDLRRYIWSVVKIDPDIQLPAFHADVLYGHVSDLIHSPSYKHVMLSNAMSPEAIAFYTALGKIYEKSPQIFSEEEAAAFSHEGSEIGFE